MAFILAVPTSYSPTPPDDTYYQAVLNDSPNAYYRFSETSGTVMADSSGNGQDGTYVNSPNLNVSTLLPIDADSAMELTTGNDYATYPTAVIPGGANPFTIECWVNLPTNITTEAFSVFMGSIGTEQAAFIDFRNNAIRFGGYSNDIDYAISYAGQTLHVVYTYDGFNRKGYVNGTEVVADTLSLNVGTSGIIGYHPYYGPGSGNGDFNGVIDEVAIYDHVLDPTRISLHYTLGTAAPPIFCYTDTILLLRSNTFDGDTTFTDDGIETNTLTPSGTVHHSTTQAKFGTSSIQWTGGGFIAFTSPSLAVGTGPFTIDFWIYPTGSFGTGGVLSSGVISGPLGFELHTNGSAINFHIGNNTAGGTGAGDRTPPLNTWTHYAFVRDDSQLIYLFENGIQVFGPTTYTTGASSTSMYVGSRYAGNASWTLTNCFIDELRISTFARWTSAFTPPTITCTP